MVALLDGLAPSAVLLGLALLLEYTAPRYERRLPGGSPGGAAPPAQRPGRAAPARLPAPADALGREEARATRAELDGDCPPARVSHRLAVDLPVTFTLDGGPPQAGRVVNLTGAGLFIATATLPGAGTAVELLLALPGADGPRHVKASAEVRWVNEARAPRATALPPGIGLQFSVLGPEVRESLGAYLAERLAALRRGAGHPPAAWRRPPPAAAGATTAAPTSSLPAHGGRAPEGGQPAGDAAGGGATATRSRAAMFRLLLADPDLRALVARERVFHHHPSHQIHVAATGEELARLATQVRPAMILLDADRLEGALEPTIARLRGSPPLRTTPLIATAARVTEMERRLRGSGVDLVLAKPVDTPGLYRVLRLLGPESGLDVRVAVGAEARYTAEGGERTGRVANLSRGGLYLAAEPLSAPGSTLALRVHLPGFPEPVALAGAVRWVNEGARAPGLPPGMGLQFIDTPPAALKTVATYVALAKDVVRVT
jgi:uncharacterized protein (TIGR02266 family)